MDREAIARAQRRRQATEALEFERDRAAALQEQIDVLIVELDGSHVDEQVFAKLAPEHAELARSLIAPAEEPADEADEDEWLIVGDEAPEGEEPEPEPDPREEAEEEIGRLQEEIAESRRRQEALEAYIAALDDTSS